MTDQVRPFKVWSCDRAVKKSLTAASLRDFIEKGCLKLGMKNTTGAVRIVLEEDGTEVDDEDYFSFLPQNSTLMLLKEGECWQPARTEAVARDETDHGGIPVREDETARLASDLRADLSHIITFSNDQLQQLVDEDTLTLAQLMGESERFSKSLQDACQRHLDERAQTTETAGLLKLYHKAHQEVKPGVKRKATSETEDG
ncbi:DNAation factor subunit alpha [Elysia marginata]|uniref:DNAation factor subunit alpha n=1 Tax=Elysia marginata TaxID=1093978 RepID=A0AAV4G902_9GAST|nr:DNAation factor subunit alpha [Elysia marginata]